jgi:branched-chain amino acid transport system ATP-binding protein
LATDALTIDGIDAFYGDSHVLHGLSFSLQAGRLLGLLGRNGAGKTTCMSTIMGFLKPRRGAISLYGEPVAGLAPDVIARRGICLVPQGRRMFRTLTVRENLMVAAQPRRSRAGTGWSLERVFALFPRLAERHAQVAGSLSGGEQQMLAIGRALMGNPRVLLMDEPSEGLAPQLVAEVGRTIAQLKAEGQSIVLVEQNIKLTLDLADDVVIINTGRVVFRGEAGQLKLDDAIVSQHLGVF